MQEKRARGTFPHGWAIVGIDAAESSPAEGVFFVDLRNALDDDATGLTANTAKNVPTTAAALYALDISKPAAATVFGDFPLRLGSGACSIGGDVNFNYRAAVEVRGSRAYVTTPDRLTVVELE